MLKLDREFFLGRSRAQNLVPEEKSNDKETEERGRLSKSCVQARWSSTRCSLDADPLVFRLAKANERMNLRKRKRSPVSSTCRKPCDGTCSNDIIKAMRTSSRSDDAEDAQEWKEAETAIAGLQRETSRFYQSVPVLFSHTVIGCAY